MEWKHQVHEIAVVEDLALKPSLVEWKLIFPPLFPLLHDRLETFLGGMETLNPSTRSIRRGSRTLKPSLVEWKHGFCDVPYCGNFFLETFLGGMETLQHLAAELSGRLALETFLGGMETLLDALIGETRRHP